MTTKQQDKRRTQAKVLRIFRKVHRTTGAALFVFFAVVAVTSILLGWKKQTRSLTQKQKPPKGISKDFKTWLPVDSLYSIASHVLGEKVPAAASPELDRVDMRKGQGVVKFVYKKPAWDVQLDGATGKLLQVEQRTPDLVRGLHDASILDYYFKTGGSEPIKLVYTSIMGLALFTFTVTGFWLWYGPKRMSRVQAKQA